MAYKFNEKYVRSISKERFIKEMEKHFPALNLAKEYDKIVPKKKEVKSQPKEDSPEI